VLCVAIALVVLLREELFDTYHTLCEYLLSQIGDAESATSEALDYAVSSVL
jgi:hypothetical protein